MIQRLRGTLEARIARERGKQVERTAGYSNNEEALRREFGIVPGLGGLESAGTVADDRSRIVDTSIVLSREPADGPCHTKEHPRPRGYREPFYQYSLIMYAYEREINDRYQKNLEETKL